MKAIEFRSVTKQFDKVRAVNELSFSLEHGSVYGLLGQNGAGKTTTLRMLMGLCRPTSGEIYVYGEKCDFDRRGAKSNIGFLPDVPEFYSYMTAKDYLTLCGQLSGTPQSMLGDAIKNSLARTGLTGVKKRIGGYSRGMKQRLGIAQALLNSPRILVLDEPTSALDPVGRHEVMEIIQSLRGEHTVLFSTHILPDIDRVCDSIGILNNGKLVLEGGIETIKQKYVNQGVTLQVRVAPERFGELTAQVKALNGVSSVQSARAGELTVATASPDVFSVELSALLSRMEIPLERYAPVELQLENVFMEVLR